MIRPEFRGRFSHAKDAAYLEALRLGYTCSVPEIYQTAGIEFNFTKDYIRDLMHFVRDELEALQ